MADLTQQDGASQQVWDAAQCEAALAHLERLQEQVSDNFFPSTKQYMG